jgi:hypothetical protein
VLGLCWWKLQSPPCRRCSNAGTQPCFHRQASEHPENLHEPTVTQLLPQPVPCNVSRSTVHRESRHPQLGARLLCAAQTLLCARSLSASCSSITECWQHIQPTTQGQAIPTACPSDPPLDSHNQLQQLFLNTPSSTVRQHSILNSSTLPAPQALTHATPACTQPLCSPPQSQTRPHPA